MKFIAKRFAALCGLLTIDPNTIIEATRKASQHVAVANGAADRNDDWSEGKNDGISEGIRWMCDEIRKQNL